jgi:hypothetical protein
MSTGPAFQDEYMDVELLNFEPYAGVAQLVVHEKHGKMGFYYIWVNFESGDSTRIDYDGGNPQRQQLLTVRTTHRNDIIKEIVVKRVRD